MQVQKLGAVDQTLAGEGDHVRLRTAPRRQRLGPLLSAAQLGDLMAELDHAAVDGAGDDGRQLAGHDRHHGLVDQGETLIHLAVMNKGAALQVPREGDQVGVTGATADRDCLRRGRPPGRVVTRHELVECDRHQEVAVLGALLLVLQETAGPAEPAACLRDVSRAPRWNVSQNAHRAARRGSPPSACHCCARCSARRPSSTWPRSRAAVASSSKPRAGRGEELSASDSAV